MFEYISLMKWYQPPIDTESHSGSIEVSIPKSSAANGGHSEPGSPVDLAGTHYAKNI
jgi:hypothetical protein